MKILSSWEDVWNYKEKLYICLTDESVNEYFKKPSGYLHNFSSFDLDKKVDYISNQENVILYLQYLKDDYYREEYKNKGHWHTFIFKKNKLYDFSPTSRWCDELGNIIDNMKYEVWYDPFFFVKEKDVDQAIRLFKLKKLEND